MMSRMRTNSAHLHSHHHNNITSSNTSNADKADNINDTAKRGDTNRLMMMTTTSRYKKAENDVDDKDSNTKILWRICKT